jgi:uncharacterized membrane protein
MILGRRVFWFIFAALALIVGLYPLIYFLVDPRFGLLGTKSPALLLNKIWNFAFYTHILMGGLALFIGWIQFSKKILSNKPRFHRIVGKIYIIATLMSGFSGIYIAFYATGGIISKLGFLCLGILWLWFTLASYFYIRNRNIEKHKKLMIFSYACCFGAVTLRIWLPLLILLFQDFTPAYRIVAWISWVPNLLVAYFLSKKAILQYANDNS